MFTNKSQKELGKILIELRDVIDFVDDGNHYRELAMLIDVNYVLYNNLSDRNKERYNDWIVRRDLKKKGVNVG